MSKKIFSAAQIEKLDLYTIENEPVSSVELMERAALICTEHLLKDYPQYTHFTILCGGGNNGGDGLCMARLLNKEAKNAVVLSPSFCGRRTDDNREQLNRFKDKYPGKYREIEDLAEEDLLENTLVLDCLFGNGLNRPVKGKYASWINQLNALNSTVVSIDLPSGLPGDAVDWLDFTAVKADMVYTFEQPKFSLLLPIFGDYAARFKILSIGLHAKGKEQLESKFIYQELPDIQKLFTQRNRFSHKGNYGHALLMGGNYGKAGAAIIAARATLKSGVGLLTVCTAANCIDVIQATIPEAMCFPNRKENPLQFPIFKINEYSAVGIGPGIGTGLEEQERLVQILKQCKSPLVLDADALNIISNLLKQNQAISFPSKCILTPHPREFERLAGPWKTAPEKLKKMQNFVDKHRVTLVLKGAHTCIATHNHPWVFNSTGNPGMATGGSGDVLTGIITALLAQGLSSFDAARAGVFIHGLAGDFGKELLGETSLTAFEIVKKIPEAFKVVVPESCPQITLRIKESTE